MKHIGEDGQTNDIRDEGKEDSDQLIEQGEEAEDKQMLRWCFGLNNWLTLGTMERGHCKHCRTRWVIGADDQHAWGWRLREFLMISKEAQVEQITVWELRISRCQWSTRFLTYADGLWNNAEMEKWCGKIRMWWLSQNKDNNGSWK